MRAIPSIRRPLVHLLVPAVMLLAACDTESLPTTPDSVEVMLAPATAAATDATLVADDQTIDTSGHAPLEVIQHEGSICFLITFEGGAHLTQIHPETNGLVPGTPVRFPLGEQWVTVGAGFSNNPSGTTVAAFAGDGIGEVTFEVPVSSVSLFYASSTPVTLDALDAGGVTVATTSGPANVQFDGFTQWDPLGVVVGTDQIARTAVIGGLFSTAIDDLDVCIESVVNIGIDLKPKNANNAIDPFSLTSKHSVSVAALSSATFDAATIDPITVGLGDPAIGTTVGAHSSTVGDVNGDGLDDVTFHFGPASDLAAVGVLDANSVEVRLSGAANGEWVVGTDAIVIVGK